MHHPWRAFRALAHFTVRWAHLPDGVWALTNFDDQTVTMAHGLNQAERRCSIEHERQHILRGPSVPGYDVAEERAVRCAAARNLVTFEQLVAAMVWAYDEHELAHELWVDVDTVRDRLSCLTAEESAELSRRMLDAELRHP